MEGHFHVFSKSNVNLISMGISHILSAKYPFCCQPTVSPCLRVTDHILICLLFHSQGKCHSIFPSCHHKNPAGNCRCCAPLAITPLPTCCSGYRRALQGSWTELRKKRSITHRLLLSPEHPRGMTVGTKPLAAKGCPKYISLQNSQIFLE